MKLGEAYVELKADATKLKAGFAQARDASGRFVKGAQEQVQAGLAGTGGMIKQWAAGIGVAAGAMMGARMVQAFMRESLDLARQQAHVEKRLEAIVRSTGEAAGFTAKQLKQMASALQEVSIYGDEAIMEAQALLLTFKQIRGEAFGRTIKVAMDMAALGMGDLRANALQLGKALQDPERQLTMLRRSGLTFSEAEERVIKALAKAGDMAQAHAKILEALEGQLGGASKATGHWADAMTQAENAWGDLKENIGGSIGPMTAGIRDLAKAMRDMSELKVKGFGAGDVLAWSNPAMALLKVYQKIKALSDSIADDLRQKFTWLPGQPKADMPTAMPKFLPDMPADVEAKKKKWTADPAAAGLAALQAMAEGFTRVAGPADEAADDLRQRLEAIDKVMEKLGPAARAWLGPMAEDARKAAEALYEIDAAQALREQKDSQLSDPFRFGGGDPDQAAAGWLKFAEQEAQAERQLWDARKAFDDEVTQSRIDNLRAAGNEAGARNAEIMQGYGQQIKKINDIEDALKQAYGVALPENFAAGIKKMREEAEGTRGAALEAAARKDFGYRAASLREIGLAAQGKLGVGGAAAGKGPEEETAENTKKTVTGIARLAQILEDRTFESTYR